MNRYLILTITAIISIVFASALIRYSEVGPIATGAYRLLLSIPMLLILNYKSFSPAKNTSTEKLTKSIFIYSALAGVFFAMDLSVYNLSVIYTSLAEATLLTNMVPFFVAPISVIFFKEKISIKFLIPVGLAIFGLYLLIGSKSSNINHLSGDLLALLSAFFYSLFFMAIKNARGNYSASKVMLIVCIVGGILLLFIAYLKHEVIFPQSQHAWLIVLLVAFFGQILGQTLLAHSVKYIPLQLATLFLLLSPVFAAIMAIPLFGEILHFSQLAGIAIILVAVHYGKKILERSLRHK